MAISNFGGISGFWINGISYGVSGSIKYQSGGDVRTAVMNSQGGLAGYTATPMAAAIELDINDSGTLTAAAINAISDAVIVAESKSGKTITLLNAFREGNPIDLDMMAGKFTLKLVGSDLELSA